MKKILLATASIVLTSGMVQAAPVNGGTVNFTGDFVDAACAVSADTANQTVPLGQYRTARLTTAGQVTSNVSFKINLVDCDTKVATTAAFSFKGTADDDDPTLLKVNAGPGVNGRAATGVGVQILDSKANVLTPDGAVFSADEPLVDGNNSIQFIARYKSTADVIGAGNAYADASFQIDYK